MYTLLGKSDADEEDNVVHLNFSKPMIGSYSYQEKNDLCKPGF